MNADLAGAPSLARIHVAVPLAHVQAVRARGGAHGQKDLLRDLQARVVRLGARPAFVAQQDPTDDRRAVVIAGAPLAPGTTDGVLHVLGTEPVEWPGGFDQTTDVPALDSGLAPDERAAVWHAILHDTDPRHVGDGGLPAVLDPYYPASASLLRAKAHTLGTLGRAFTPADGAALLRAAADDPGDATIDAARHAFERFAATSPLPLAIWRDRAREAIAALTQDPRAPLARFPFPIQALARAIVRPLPANPAVWIAPPQRLARALPGRPEDAFVSPSAMQLALAAQKPKWSGVHTPSTIGAILGGVQHGPPTVDRLRVRHQMDRAQKAIDRRRWVEWYKHHRQLRTASL